MKHPALLPVALAAAVLLPSAAAAQTTVRAGQSVRGDLSAQDLRLTDKSYADQYLYRGRQGERLVVTLRSGAFDTYLGVGRGRGSGFTAVESDDDGAGGTDSRVELTLPADGEYVIQVNSLRAAQTGAYTLEVGGASGGGAGNGRSGDGDGEAADPGTRVERGTLGPGDATLQTGEYQDSYTVRGRRGERLVVDLRSAELDPYVMLVLPDGKHQENDDYEGDQHRSLISLELPQDGEYRVVATTYRPGTTGSYELRIGQGGSTAARGARRRERGELRAGDQRLNSGEFADRYTVDVLPGQRLRVDLSSSAFDTYVVVKDPRGEQTDNDDAEGQPGHAVVDMRTAEAGTYTVLATSYRAGETGPYELAIDLDAAPAGAERTTQAATLTLGGSARGRLQSGDPTLPSSGEFSDTYLVEGRPGQTLVVEMSSPEFDTYLLVRTPEGESLDNDDHEGSSSRSRLEVPMRSTGRYRVVATSYRRGETGAYTLAASARGSTPSTASSASAQPRGAAGGRMGTGRGGRVHGVFVGVSDYGGRAGDLSYTARDAGTMRDALVRGAGMRAEDAVVLTDRQATVANVRAAVARVAARVGPDDTFVFFHSGHGDRVATRGTDDDDPDGLDETIEMYDAAIRDDELGTMLDAVRGGLSMVVIDACFSGGFSKDVINRPNRIGFFSSEEDVVSAVAPKFRAGGFLPVFFAEAVGDHRGDREDASLAPTPDGQLTLLELSQYLRERYGTEVKSTGLAGPGGGVTRDELNYQHLVVDRGGVDAYSVMFRW